MKGIMTNLFIWSQLLGAITLIGSIFLLRKPVMQLSLWPQLVWLLFVGVAFLATGVLTLIFGFKV